MLRREFRRAAIAGLLACFATVAVNAHEASVPDPVDPYAPVTHTHYHPVLNQYRATPIVERPTNWRELNDRAEQIGGPLGQLRSVNEPIRKRKRN